MQILFPRKEIYRLSRENFGSPERLGVNVRSKIHLGSTFLFLIRLFHFVSFLKGLISPTRIAIHPRMPRFLFSSSSSFLRRAHPPPPSLYLASPHRFHSLRVARSLPPTTTSVSADTKGTSKSFVLPPLSSISIPVSSPSSRPVPPSARSLLFVFTRAD